jgi:hypothetical protein
MTTDRSDVARARADLAAAIDAIQYKLNVPARVSERVQRLRKENPAVLAGLLAGAAIALAGAVWGVVRLIRR